MNAHRVTIWILVLMMLVGSAARAEDRDTEQARQHLHKAKQAYDLGRWDEAISEYEKAYTFRNEPILLFNMAQAYRRRGDLQRAIDLYKNYLIRDPNTAQRADVEERIRMLQKQLEKVDRPGAAAPAAPPPEVSPTPTPAPAAPTAAVPAPAAATTPLPQAIAAPPAAVPLASDTAPAPRPVSDGIGRRPLKIAGMALGGAGVVAVGVGVFMGWRAHSLSSEITSDANRQPAGTFDNSKYESGKTAETWQWIGIGAGSAALAAGALCYWWGGRAESSRAVSFTVVPSIGNDSAGAQLAFGF